MTDFTIFIVIILSFIYLFGEEVGATPNDAQG